MVSFKVLAAILIFASLHAGATNQCVDLFKERPPAAQIIAEVNSTYNNFLYNEQIEENFNQYGFLRRIYSVRQLRKTLKTIDKNGDGFDQHDLLTVLFKLDQLTFADLVESGSASASNLSFKDKKILSDVRRRLLYEGFSKYLPADDIINKSVWRKTKRTFAKVFSARYLQWLGFYFRMPKLYGVHMPLALAEKIALEGLDKHREEAEKYIPKTVWTAYFNVFSKVYNRLFIASLFTVVPYMLYHYQQEQVIAGGLLQEQKLEPIVESTKAWSEQDFYLLREESALNRYNAARAQELGHEPSLAEMEAARKMYEDKHPRPST